MNLPVARANACNRRLSLSRQGMELNHNIIVLDVEHRAMKINDSRAVADAIQRNRSLKKRQVRLHVQPKRRRSAEGLTWWTCTMPTIH